jgi:hypothetical protein
MLISLELPLSILSVDCLFDVRLTGYRALSFDAGEDPAAIAQTALTRNDYLFVLKFPFG